MVSVENEHFVLTPLAINELMKRKGMTVITNLFFLLIFHNRMIIKEKLI